MIDQLTTLRAFAALYIVLYHYRVYLSFDVSDYTKILDHGYMAVDFFFLLSGFILAHVYSKWFTGFHRQVILKFLWYRFARLYPVHIVMMAAFVLYYLLITNLGFTPNNPDRYRFDAIPSHLLLVHAWGFDTKEAWNGPSWSVSAELSAYLLFPILGVLYYKVLKKRKTLAFLLSVVLFIVLEETVGVVKREYNFSVLQILPEFLIGFLAYKIKDEINIKNISDICGVAAILSLVVLLHFGANRAIIILNGAAIIFCLYHSDDFLKNFCSLRPLVYLGEISYSIYMVHSLVQVVWFNSVWFYWPEFSEKHSVETTILGLVLAVGCAACLYHLVERPARGLLRKVDISTKLGQRLV